jgi:hypothetical protein
MKLSFDNLVNSKLAVIPLYPAVDWNNNQKDGTKSSDAARVAFKEVKLELRANPDDSNSLKYGMYFKVFDNGSPEQWCRWRDDLKRAWTGLGNTNGPLRAATVRHLLEGQALDDFEMYMQSEGVTETLEHVNKALKRVAVTIFPSDAVTAIKHYLNFELTKPHKLSARATATRLDRINNWLEFFPTDGDGRVGTVPM